MQNNEAINKGIERDSVSRSLTHTFTYEQKKSTTMDHNNVLNNTIDCHPHVE